MSLNKSIRIFVKSRRSENPNEFHQNLHDECFRGKTNIGTHTSDNRLSIFHDKNSKPHIINFSFDRSQKKPEYSFGRSSSFSFSEDYSKINSKEYYESLLKNNIFQENIALSGYINSLRKRKIENENKLICPRFSKKYLFIKDLISKSSNKFQKKNKSSRYQYEIPLKQLFSFHTRIKHILRPSIIQTKLINITSSNYLQNPCKEFMNFENLKSNRNKSHYQKYNPLFLISTHISKNKQNCKTSLGLVIRRLIGAKHFNFYRRERGDKTALNSKSINSSFNLGNSKFQDHKLSHN